MQRFIHFQLTKTFISLDVSGRFDVNTSNVDDDSSDNNGWQSQIPVYDANGDDDADALANSLCKWKNRMLVILANKVMVKHVDKGFSRVCCLVDGEPIHYNDQSNIIISIYYLII